jgi:uncharacterized protein YkwD
MKDPTGLIHQLDRPSGDDSPLKPLSLLALLLLTAALLVLGAAGSENAGPLGPQSAEAKKRCPGGKRSPRNLKVSGAQRLVICLVNKRREARGLRRLKRHKSVNRAAVRHTREMRRKRCFSHTCPGEPDLTGRLTRADYLPCGCSWSAGENIAWGAGKKTGSPAKIVRAWMRSPSHRSTMLQKSLEHIGVGFRRGSPYSGKSKLATYTLDVGYKR